MFCSNMHNFDLISKIFTGFIEQTFRHLHVKYLSNEMILKFSHKLAVIDILEFDKSKWITKNVHIDI